VSGQTVAAATSRTSSPVSRLHMAERARCQGEAIHTHASAVFLTGLGKVVYSLRETIPRVVTGRQKSEQ